nr:hypothetical protein CFP56_34853 [Quercus suber]
MLVSASLDGDSCEMYIFCEIGWRNASRPINVHVPLAKRLLGMIGQNEPAESRMGRTVGEIGVHFAYCIQYVLILHSAHESETAGPQVPVRLYGYSTAVRGSKHPAGCALLRVVSLALGPATVHWTVGGTYSQPGGRAIHGPTPPVFPKAARQFRCSWLVSPQRIDAEPEKKLPRQA